jgi:superfamily II DNA helicase RecQ
MKHIVFQNGVDFRPEYNLKHIIKQLRCTIGLTATATPKYKKWKLDMSDKTLKLL